MLQTHNYNGSLCRERMSGTLAKSWHLLKGITVHTCITNREKTSKAITTSSSQQTAIIWQKGSRWIWWLSTTMSKMSKLYVTLWAICHIHRCPKCPSFVDLSIAFRCSRLFIFYCLRQGSDWMVPNQWRREAQTGTLTRTQHALPQKYYEILASRVLLGNAPFTKLSINDRVNVLEFLQIQLKRAGIYRPRCSSTSSSSFQFQSHG